MVEKTLYATIKEELEKLLIKHGILKESAPSQIKFNNIKH